MTVTIPGGWCLSPWENASGLTAWWLLYGSDQFRAWLGGVLTEALGGSPASQNLVQDALNRAWDANAPILDQQVTEWGEVIYATWAPTAVLEENLRDTLVLTAQALQRIKGAVVANGPAPGAPPLQQQIIDDANAIEAQLQQLQQWAAQGFVIAAGEAAQAQANAEAFAQAGIDQAEAQATAQIQQALDQAIQQATTDSQLVEQWVQQIIAEVNVDLTNLINEVNAQLQTLETYIATGVSQAEAFAQTATEQGLANAQAQQSQQLITTLSPGWAGTAESANAATEALVTEHPEEAQNVELVPTATPPDLITAVAGLGTIMKTVTQTLNDCALPNCNIKNKVANDLKNLFGSAEAGLVLGLLVYCATDPTGAAHDAERVVTTAGETIVNAARSVFGLGG